MAYEQYKEHQTRTKNEVELWSQDLMIRIIKSDTHSNSVIATAINKAREETNSQMCDVITLKNILHRCYCSFSNEQAEIIDKETVKVFDLATLFDDEESPKPVNAFLAAIYSEYEKHQKLVGSAIEILSNQLLSEIIYSDTISIEELINFIKEGLPENKELFKRVASESYFTPMNLKQIEPKQYVSSIDEEIFKHMVSQSYLKNGENIKIEQNNSSENIEIEQNNSSKTIEIEQNSQNIEMKKNTISENIKIQQDKSIDNIKTLKNQTKTTQNYMLEFMDLEYDDLDPNEIQILNKNNALTLNTESSRMETRGKGIIIY